MATCCRRRNPCQSYSSSPTGSTALQGLQAGHAVVADLPNLFPQLLQLLDLVLLERASLRLDFPGAVPQLLRAVTKPITTSTTLRRSTARGECAGATTFKCSSSFSSDSESSQRPSSLELADACLWSSRSCISLT